MQKSLNEKKFFMDNPKKVVFLQYEFMKLNIKKFYGALS